MAIVRRTITIELEESVAADVDALLERNGFRLEDHVVELLTLETVWVEAGDATLADALERIRLEFAALQRKAAEAARKSTVTTDTDEWGNKTEINHEMGG